MKFLLNLDRPVAQAGDSLRGSLCIDQTKQNVAASFDALTLELQCVEHYSYDETTTSTDSEGNSTSSTVTHHVEKISASIAVPLVPIEPATFSRDDAVWPVGVHHFRFQVTLPPDALCSFVATVYDVTWRLRVLEGERLLGMVKPAVTVVPPPVLPGEGVTAGGPLSEVQGKGRFTFAKGEIELRLSSPQQSVDVEGERVAVLIDAAVTNNSSKTVKAVTVSLVRLYGHWPAQLDASRGGQQVCSQVTLHETLKPGESFVLPLTSVTLALLAAWPRDQFVTVSGALVYAQFAIRLQAHVSWATDKVVNLPVELVVDGSGAAAEPKKAQAAHAAHVEPDIACPCATASWGSLRVVVRALANLPRKNVIHKGADPFVWLRLHGTEYALRTGVHRNVTDLLVLDEGGAFAGGVAVNRALSVVVSHRSLVDSVIGQLEFDWPALAALTPLPRQTTLPPVPPLPTAPAAASSTAALETAGAWLPLDGKHGAMICLLVQRESATQK